MAKVKTNITAAFRKAKKVTRKGIHAKCKSSRSKTSKNYVKLSRGQG
jgi:hypothetical protein